MSTVDQIIAEIETLPPRDFSRLEQWFAEKYWEQWDREIEEDSKSGKLDFLIKEALEEKAQGKLRDL